MFGSILAHGDQAAHSLKSLTWAKATSCGAATVSARETVYVLGRVEMTMTRIARTATRPMRTFFHGGGPFRGPS
jgi:hypothetical protein